MVLDERNQNEGTSEVWITKTIFLKQEMLLGLATQLSSQ
jgi:hypothetical protein